MYVLCNTEARSCNHFCCGKVINIITYSECVFVDIVIQHAVRMRRIVVSVACNTVQYTSRLHGVSIIFNTLITN